MKAFDTDVNRREEPVSDRSLWRQKLDSALKRGGKQTGSKLQMKREHGGRTARQQPDQIQPTGAAAATATATLKWACTVTTGAALPTETHTGGAHLSSLEID